MTTEQVKTICSFASVHHEALGHLFGGFDEVRGHFFGTTTNYTAVHQSRPSWMSTYNKPILMESHTTVRHFFRVHEGGDIDGCKTLINRTAAVISAYAKAYTQIGMLYVKSRPYAWDNVAIATNTANLIADTASLRQAIGYVVTQLKGNVSSFLEKCRAEYLDANVARDMILDNIHIDPASFPERMHSHPRDWFEQAEQRKIAQAIRTKQKRAEKKNLASASAPRPAQVITPRRALLNQIAGSGLQPLGIN
jgi:hypothetical protein